MRSAWKCAAVMVIAHGLGAAAVRGDDWPQWLGPKRDGIWRETGIVDQLPEKLHYRWRVPIDRGYSGPVVASGRVYVTDRQVKPRSVERTLCFDEATGKQLWSWSQECTYAADLDLSDADGPRATPLVHDGKIYTVGTMGQLACLEVAKGECIWQKDLVKEFDAAPPYWGMCASPLIEGDLLIVVVGGKGNSCVVAFNRNTGDEVWKALKDRAGYSSPLVIDAAGKRQLIVWTEDSVASLDPMIGTTYWRLPFNSQYAAVATPLFARTRLLISGLMLELGDDKPAAKVLWPERKTASERIYSNVSNPVLQDGHAYSAKSSGELICVDADTGKLVWESKKVTTLVKWGASVHLTPNGERTFLFTDRGELILAKLTPNGYEELSRTLVLEPTTEYRQWRVNWSHPAYANRHVFVRNDKELTCVSLATE